MMKIFKTLPFYFLFIVFVFLFWLVLALITVLMGETIGIRPGRVVLGILGIASIKLAYNIAWRLTKKTRGVNMIKENKKKVFLILLGLLLLTGWFYWTEWRPEKQIEKKVQKCLDKILEEYIVEWDERCEELGKEKGCELSESDTAEVSEKVNWISREDCLKKQFNN